MAVQTPVRILIIDDSDRDERARFNAEMQEQHVCVVVRHPRDVIKSDLDQADLVLVDYLLEDWSERDSMPICLGPQNGLAIIAILKSLSATDARSQPRAFLLRSAKLTELSHDYNSHRRLYLLARENNLEWILDKVQPLSEQLPQVISLATAIRALPSAWPSDDAVETKRIVLTWLGISNNSWREMAWHDIESAHPPLHSLHEQRHGLRFLRWFLHRILPYPCFLWTCSRLAARLRVTVPSLTTAMSAGLEDCFAPAKYTGHLHDFMGNRWWRAGCESILWELTNGRSFDPDQIVAALNQRCGDRLVKLSFLQPVLCVDTNCQMGEELCDVEKAVRLQPDDWPPYAESAWCRIADAKGHPYLEAIVIDADLERFESDSESETEV